MDGYPDFFEGSKRVNHGEEQRRHNLFLPDEDGAVSELQLKSEHTIIETAGSYSAREPVRKEGLPPDGASRSHGYLRPQRFSKAYTIPHRTVLKPTSG